MSLRINRLPCFLLAWLAAAGSSSPAFSQAMRQADPPQQAPSATAPLAPSGRPSDPPMPAPAKPPEAAPPPADSKLNDAQRWIDDFNNLLKKSADGVSSTLQSTVKGSQQTLENLNTQTKSATEGLTKLQAMVDGRVQCPIAGNGAPDCETAAKMLCRTKGYKSGSSVDIATTEKCSVKAYLRGRTGAPGECRTENYVTRAMCQ